MTNADVFRSKLIADGFGVFVDQLVAASQVGFELQVREPLSNESPTLGVTKLGGIPDVPLNFDWPYRVKYPDDDPIVQMHKKSAVEHRSRTKPDRYHKTLEEHLSAAQNNDSHVETMTNAAPLSFIGQFNLGDIQKDADHIEGLPTSGRLLLFYDADTQPWGDQTYEQKFFKLIFDQTQSDRLHSMAGPDTTEQFDTTYLVAQKVFCPVPPDTIISENLLIEDGALVPYRDWWFDVWQQEAQLGPRHLLRGWPDVIQGDMQLPAEILSRGHSTDETDIYDFAKNNNWHKTAEEWVLLLQVASEEASNMLWGDSGCLYIWIRKTDLSSKNFDDCYLQLQCT